MPPIAETDPTARIGLETGVAAFTAASALAFSTGDALANSNGADVEKTALAAWNNAPTRDINSFAAPASVATSQVVEVPAAASTSSDETLLVPGPNGLISAEASAAPIDCIRAILREPKMRYAYMVYPGDRRKQIINTEARIRPTSAACRGSVTLKPPKVVFRIENPKKHNQWKRSKPQKLEDENDLTIGDEGGIGNASLYISGYDDGIKKPHLRYRCSRKGGVSRAQAVYRMSAYSTVHDRVFSKSYIAPVKVQPVPRFNPVQGGGVRRAC